MLKLVPFMATVLFLWGITTYILVFPTAFVNDWLALTNIPEDVRIYLLILVFVNLFVSFAAERWFFSALSKWTEAIWWRFKSRGLDVPSNSERKRLIKRVRWREKGKIYKLIEDELVSSHREHP